MCASAYNCRNSYLILCLILVLNPVRSSIDISKEFLFVTRNDVMAKLALIRKFLLRTNFAVGKRFSDSKISITKFQRLTFPGKNLEGDYLEFHEATLRTMGLYTVRVSMLPHIRY